MAMLQTYSPSQSSSYSEDREQSLELSHFIAIFRRRIFYFAIPFVLLLITGSIVVAIQRPIYHAEGKILVESPQIPANLVEQTVTAAATERIQVIQQRLMSRDNLVPIMTKFGLFPSQRQWMSGTELLDLMRDRAQIQLLDIDELLAPVKDGKPAPVIRSNNKNSAIAFTVSFDYENPELAMRVANDFLTSILNEDVRARTGRASETTQFLTQEVKRLQDKLDAVDAQIAKARQAAADPTKGNPDDAEQQKLQIEELTKLKASLAQAMATYADAHPIVKSLKKRIAALQQDLSKTTNPTTPEDKNVFALVQQRKSVADELDDANKKMTVARLGESLERNQEAEHLQVLEQPSLPQKPIKPKRLKFMAMVLALAAGSGIALIVLAEMLDKSIRSTRELAGVVDSHLLVAIPYITTTGEISRRRRKIILFWIGLALFLAAGLAFALYIGVEIQFFNFDRSWIDTLTRLSK